MLTSSETAEFCVWCNERALDFDSRGRSFLATVGNLGNDDTTREVMGIKCNQCENTWSAHKHVEVQSYYNHNSYNSRVTLLLNNLNNWY